MRTPDLILLLLVASFGAFSWLSGFFAGRLTAAKFYAVQLQRIRAETEGGKDG